MSHKLIPILFALTACGGGIGIAPGELPPVDDRDAGTVTVHPDAGHALPDAGEVDPVDAGAVDAGTVVDPPVDAGAPEQDAGPAVVVDAGPTTVPDAGDDACDNSLGDYWLVTGSTCGRQTRVACIQRWDECGFIGQPGCQLNGARATASGFCVEGAWPAGSNGACSHCR